MEVYKNVITDNNYELIFKNDENEIFKISYNGSDLYWTMINYRDGNKFQITEAQETLYYQLKELFRKMLFHTIKH